MPALSRGQIIALVGFVIMLIAIPISFYLVKQTQIFKSKAAAPAPSGPVTQTPTSQTQGPSAADLLKTGALGSSGAQSSPSASENLAFGPTMDLTISIEGRPTAKQADKVFVGIAAGSVLVNPTYILTFSIDVPDSGNFKGLSLAGLNPGSNYTAYIKGSATIDTGTTFTMSPTTTVLNQSNPVNLIAGDLNEDNVVNSADYGICMGLYGTTTTSNNWNPRADFNLDGRINSYDLAIITRNIGKTGSSGPWVSTPKVSTPSAQLVTKPNVGGPPAPIKSGPADFGSVLSASTNSASEIPETSHKGYWIFVP